MGALVLMGGVSKKNRWMGGGSPAEPPTMGNPETFYLKGFIGRDGIS